MSRLLRTVAAAVAVVFALLESSSHSEGCVPFDPSGHSIMAYKVGGRLGNQMMGYAMLLAVNRTYGYPVYLEKRVLDNLGRYFEGTTAIPALESICDVDEVSWESFALKPKDLGENESLRKGLAMEIPEKTRLLGDNVMRILGFEAILKPLAGELEAAFTFREKFMRTARKSLTEVAADYNVHWRRQKKKKKKSSQKNDKWVDPLLVGVHVRKADSDSLIVKRYKMPPLRASYYLQAMDLFREKYRHVAFVLVGDDQEWIRRSLAPRTGSSFATVAGSGDPHDPDGVGADLALLAGCNHTVESYGTYSFWAGFLAGGKRALPFMTSVGSQRIRKKQTESALDVELSRFAMADTMIDYLKDQQVKD